MMTSMNVLKIAARGLLPLALCVAVLLLVYAARAQSDESGSRLTVMSQEQLDGAAVGAGAETLHVQGGVRALNDAEGVYEELFSLDAGAADAIAPASALEAIGIEAVGQTACVLADGSEGQCTYGVARLEFMGESKEGRIVFGPEGVRPALGRSALEAIGFSVDPATQTLKRLAPVAQ